MIEFIAHLYNLLLYFRSHCMTQYVFSSPSSSTAASRSSKSKQSQSQSYVTTDGQSASLSWCQAPIWGLRPDFCYCQTLAGLLMWGALSDERTGLPFTIAVGPRQCSHYWVRVPRDSCPYFTVSNSRLPQPGGPGPRIYIPEEQGGPLIPTGTGFPFRRLLRLAGLRWRYSTRLHTGFKEALSVVLVIPPRSSPNRKHRFLKIPLLL
jgi:hypothetical protein